MKKKKDVRKKYMISEKQLIKIKHEVSKEATNKALLIILKTVQEQFHMTEDELEQFGKTVARYASYVEKGTVTPREVQDIINRNSEFKITGF